MLPPVFAPQRSAGPAEPGLKIARLNGPLCFCAVCHLEELTQAIDEKEPEHRHVLLVGGRSGDEPEH